MIFTAALLAAAPLSEDPPRLPNYRTCLWQQMVKLDDGKTQVETMATMIEASCRRQYLDLANSDWTRSDNGLAVPGGPTAAELRARLESERTLLIERIKVFRANPRLK